MFSAPIVIFSFNLLKIYLHKFTTYLNKFSLTNLSIRNWIAKTMIESGTLLKQFNYHFFYYQFFLLLIQLFSITEICTRVFTALLIAFQVCILLLLQLHQGIPLILILFIHLIISSWFHNVRNFANNRQQFIFVHRHQHVNFLHEFYTIQT